MTHQTSILLISNNPELRQLYHEILIAEHWEILVVNSITNALLQLVSNLGINLIILDAQINATEINRLLKIINKKQNWQQLPIILLNYENNNFDLNQRLKQRSFIHYLNTHLTSPDQLIKLTKKLLHSKTPN